MRDNSKGSEEQMIVHKLAPGAADLLETAVVEIDKMFGTGYARDNPVLVAAFMQLDAATPRSESSSEESALITGLRRDMKIADDHYDGHLTLLKFTHGWKLVYGTPVLTQEARNRLFEMKASETFADLFHGDGERTDLR